MVRTSHPDCDERWHPGEHPVHYVRRVALAKAQATMSTVTTTSESPILTADTTVWIRPTDAPLGKPADEAELLQTLSALRVARRHHVTTAFSLVAPNGDITTDHVTTHVHLTPPTASKLSAYVASAEWRDKAGGYAIQGTASAWVSRIEGSYPNVVGLPVVEVVRALERLGDGSPDTPSVREVP